MRASSSALPSTAVRIYWAWILFIKSACRTRASLKAALMPYFAKPSPSSPDSAPMRVANLNNGGMKAFAVRLYCNAVPPK